MKIDWALATDTGRVRNQNEDSAIVRETEGTAVLCDGMGGHLAGEVASRIGVTTFTQSLAEGGDAIASTGDDRAETLLNIPAERVGSGVHDPDRRRMIAAVRAANSAIHRAALAAAEHAGMGCTLVALHLAEGRARYVSVGDSRLYRVRNGAITQVTEDHTRLRMFARLGIPLDPGEARMLRGVLTRALGTTPGIDVDHGEMRTVAGDIWILCSDGLTDELEDDAIRAIIEKADDARAAAGACVTAAVRAGGRDNVTVVVARVLESPETDVADGEISPPATDPAEPA
jgi:protein phosphatase